MERNEALIYTPSKIIPTYPPSPPSSSPPHHLHRWLSLSWSIDSLKVYILSHRSLLQTESPSSKYNIYLLPRTAVLIYQPFSALWSFQILFLRFLKILWNSLYSLSLHFLSESFWDQISRSFWLLSLRFWTIFCDSFELFAFLRLNIAENSSQI